MSRSTNETIAFAAKPLAPVPGILQRKCGCGNHTVAGGECSECSKSGSTLQRATQNSQSQSSGGVPPVVNEVLRSPGRPLDGPTRAFFEPRFGHDFSRVRIHSDTQAAASAQALRALAYTVGPDIVFANGQYDPGASSGRLVLAHELTHVVQQSQMPLRASREIKLGTEDGLEQQADATALAIHRGLQPRPINSAGASASVMMLTPDAFRKDLGATQDQKTAMDALFADKTFLSLWTYLQNCQATPKKDLGPLTLKVTPGLKIGGVERYGGYNPATRTLEINPTKPEHKANTAELVDTVVHELIHAVDDLQVICSKAGSSPAPLGGAATASAPSRSAVAGTADETKLMLELGPGVSNPCEEFVDINKAAQQMIIQIIKNNIKVAKVGTPTLIFVNELLRTDPKAMSEYVKCRDAACAMPVVADRDKAIAVCSANILSKYMPKAASPTPKKKP